MGDIKYWEKRKAQRMFEYMQDAEETADLIAKSYHKASGYINHQLDEIYSRFKSKHRLSDAEARQLLNKLQDKTSYKELLDMLKQETDSDEKKELLKLIESPAYSARIQRLQDAQNELDVLMRQQYHLEKDRSTRHYTNLASDSYYKSIFDIQHDTGLAFSFSKISPKQIDAVLNSKWSGTNYSSRIWNNTSKLAQDLKEELLINLLTGRSDREVAEIISNKFGAGAMEARRLVRTESCYISNEMEMQSYEECDVEYYRFIATLDKRTSDTCREHDMKRYPVAKRQPGVNCPPMHPWCRSTTIVDLGGDTLESLTRRARDPETGKTYTVPGDMSYQQWYDKYVANNPNAAIADKAYPNVKNDKAQYEKYKAVYRDDKNFESFENYQRMKYNGSEQWQGYKSLFKSTEMNNFISDSGYAFIKDITDNEALVKPLREIKVVDFTQHAEDNIKFKIDRKDMTIEKAQKFVDDSKIVIYRKSNRTFKFMADNGYCVLNDKDNLVTAVPQKWRKQYDKYLE